jgi:hypothetical protein
MRFLKTSYCRIIKKSPSVYVNLGFTLLFEYILKQLIPAEKLATLFYIHVSVYRNRFLFK